MSRLLPKGEAVSLSEVKSFLQIDDTSFDALLPIIIGAAVSRCENYANLTFGQQEIDFAFQGFVPKNEQIDVPFGKHAAILSAVLTDKEGVQTTYSVSELSLGGFVKLICPVDVKATDTLTFRTICGYTAAEMPPVAKLAILQTCAAYFENRGDIGTSIVDLPESAKKLLSGISKNLWFA